MTFSFVKDEPRMPVTPELLDQLLKDYPSPEDLMGDDGLLQQLTKVLVERALQGELTHHLGYAKHAPEGKNSGNSRNGTSSKTVKGKRGQLEIEVPRDRNGEFEPQLIKKGPTRFDGLDEKIISLYARGMTVHEIQGHLEEMYGVEISPSLISTNAIESLNMTLCKISKNRALFPSDEAAGPLWGKLFYLALRNISKKWTMPIPEWSSVMHQFAIIFEGRVPMGGLGTNTFTQAS